MIRLWPFGRGFVSLEDEIASWVAEVWQTDGRDQRPIPSGWWLLQQDGNPERDALEESLRRLTARWSPAEIGPLAADMYFDDPTWRLRYPQPDTRHRAIDCILGACLVRYRPPNLPQRIERRLRAILEDPTGGRISLDELRHIPASPDPSRSPTLETCLALLRALPPDAGTLDVIEAIARGRYDLGPFPAPAYHDEPEITAYPLHREVLLRYVPGMLETLFEHDRLSYETFAEAARHLPGILPKLAYRARQARPDDRSSRFIRTMAEWIERLADEAARDLTREHARALVSIPGLRGNRYLILAARHHAALRLGRLAARGKAAEDPLAAAVMHLARAARPPASPDERQALLADLSAVPAASLKAILPFAVAAHDMICEALGWDAALPLVDRIVTIARIGADPGLASGDVGDSADPMEGVVDVAGVREALALAGEPLAAEVVALFRGAMGNATDALTLIEAVAGRNRERIEKGIQKRSQIDVKAYGLLPLERGDDELLERYRFLTRFERESRKHGPRRASAEQAAAAVALENLARTAGYRDATRLEWAMQARLGGESSGPGMAWTVDGYRIELALDGAQPDLRVRHGDRPVKAVPAAVRKSAAYAEIKDVLETAREQAARYRATLESMMAAGETLDAAELWGLCDLPVARAMLERLVLVDSTEISGLVDAERRALVTLDGATVPVTGPVRVVHAYDLHRAGVLAAWQEEVERRGLTQPFKQVARELYLLAPDELAANTTRRFAGHRLDARVVARLLESRGWDIDTRRSDYPRKPLPESGLWGVWALSGMGHYLAETDTVVSGEISFRRRGEPASAPPVPLADVPPRVVSELLRDASLVVSVAHAAEPGRPSLDE